MWSRDTIKNYAKSFLREHYWKAFVVCLIALVVTGGASSNNSNNKSTNDNFLNENQIIRDIQNNSFIESDNFVVRNTGRFLRNTPLRYFILGTLPMMFFIFGIILITVGFAVEVGVTRFFLEGFKGNASISNVVSTFNSREYWTIVKTQFLRKFYNVLWTLLLVIPGIIKHYEYSMVPYILAEEPDLGPNDIITRSRDITRGHKLDMLILDISFLGWYILGGFFCGVGIVFVNPYREATYAKLYNVLSGNDDNIILE